MPPIDLNSEEKQEYAAIYIHYCSRSNCRGTNQVRVLPLQAIAQLWTLQSITLYHDAF